MMTPKTHHTGHITRGYRNFRGPHSQLHSGLSRRFRCPKLSSKAEASRLQYVGWDRSPVRFNLIENCSGLWSQATTLLIRNHHGETGGTVNLVDTKVSSLDFWGCPQALFCRLVLYVGWDRSPVRFNLIENCSGLWSQATTLFILNHQISILLVPSPD